jgi:hypothetical protein
MVSVKCGEASAGDLERLVVGSSQVPVAGIVWAEWVCLGLGTEGRPRVQASLRIDGRGDPPGPVITSKLPPSTRRPIRFCPCHLFTPLSLCLSARREEGNKPRAFSQIGTRPPGRWGNARRANTGPAVKTSNPDLTPRDADAPSVAFGLGVRILAAGPAHLRLYSHPRHFVNADLKSSRAPRATAAGPHPMQADHA